MFSGFDVINIMCLSSSELAQKVAISELAESIMTFNTNYKDTGLFGIYAVAKVNLEFHIYPLA